jgi:hypothetical protein
MGLSLAIATKAAAARPATATTPNVAPPTIPATAPAAPPIIPAAAAAVLAAIPLATTAAFFLTAAVSRQEHLGHFLNSVRDFCHGVASPADVASTVLGSVAVMMMTVAELVAHSAATTFLSTVWATVFAALARALVVSANRNKGDR